MCEVVKTCHEQGIVLRDLKLRKFVFADSERWVCLKKLFRHYEFLSRYASATDYKIKFGKSTSMIIYFETTFCCLARRRCRLFFFFFRHWKQTSHSSADMLKFHETHTNTASRQSSLVALRIRRVKKSNFSIAFNYETKLETKLELDLFFVWSCSFAHNLEAAFFAMN